MTTVETVQAETTRLYTIAQARTAIDAEYTRAINAIERGDSREAIRLLHLAQHAAAAAKQDYHLNSGLEWERPISQARAVLPFSC